MLASPSLQPHLITTIQLYQTSNSAISRASVLNYAVVSKFGKVLIRKINASIWFEHKEEELNGKRKYKMWGEHICHNPKRHISLVVVT